MGNIFTILCADAFLGRCLDWIARQARYVCKIKDNLEALQTAKDELQALRNDVDRAAPYMVRTEQVGGWISQVDAVIPQATTLIDRGEEEREKLCIANFCYRNCKSSYIYGKNLARSLARVIDLKATGANFKDLVNMNEPSKKLQSVLETLKATREQLFALKVEVNLRIASEEGPEWTRLKQVKEWLFAVETAIVEADELITEGPQEVSKICRGDISNYEFFGVVSNKLGVMVTLKSHGDFDEVVGRAPKADFRHVVERALPERVHEMIQGPSVGTRAMLEEAWSCLVNNKVSILGICGIEGIGKTTLLTEINNKFANTPSDFNVVMFVVVSKDFKLEKIQEDIGKQIGVHDEKWLKKSSGEKAKDISYMMRKYKFVLLLDDVWRQFDLRDVGVPPPNVIKNGSKIVITARSSAVCSDMDAKKIIRVEPLTSEDAWNLFHKKAGDINVRNLHIARQVAFECCGIPIRLVSIGRDMASKTSTKEWKRTLDTLERSSQNPQGMVDEIYQDPREACRSTIVSSDPILIDDGKKSFWLDKESGKKCYMISARGLMITWGDTSEYWRWIKPDENSRFKEIAELRSVWWLEIKGRINTDKLSKTTNYGAYLVYRLRGRAFGFKNKAMEAVVGLAKYGGNENHLRTLYLDAKNVKERRDGWLEIELGDFFNVKGEDGDLKMSVKEVKRLNEKGGLLVQGIEIRPKFTM